MLLMKRVNNSCPIAIYFHVLAIFMAHAVLISSSVTIVPFIWSCHEKFHQLTEKNNMLILKYIIIFYFNNF